MTDREPGRREQILQAFAAMLEQPGTRITTAALAREVGVSEAALYRHFPSKARMYEGLMEFLEDAIFSRFQMIRDEEPSPAGRCNAMLLLILRFCEQNPGFSRLLTGEALTGEHQRLRQRMGQFSDRVETELRNVLRDGELATGQRPLPDGKTAARLLMAVTEGRIAQFARSDFRRLPAEDWARQWQRLQLAIWNQPASQ